jgi:hypothetical protein
MKASWQPYSEPLRTTLMRAGTIAIVAGAVLARFWGGLDRWPMTTLLVLWPSLGGHWVEIGFLNWLRPRLSAARRVQIAARIAVWFVGGMAMTIGMRLTTRLFAQPAHWPRPWQGGLAFIGIELVVHLAPQLRGRPSFYNRRG